VTNWDQATYEALQEDIRVPEVIPNEAVERQIATLQHENEGLKESIAEVRAMMGYEDLGWQLIAGVTSGEKLEGLDLSEVQAIADKISPRVAAGSLPKRAVDLHAGFIWGRGCYIEGTEKPKGRGAPKAARKFFTDKTNQEAVFSDTAREELQKARFISGNVLAACNTKTKKVDRIPFNQIIGIKVDKDFPEKVIAYKRQWDTQDGTNNSVKTLWYYTSRFQGTRQKTFTKDNVTVKVAEETIVDLRVNRQVGHVLGIPDGLAGLAWSEAYGQIMQYGQVVNESLAKILFKVTNSTKQGVQSTGVKISNFGDHGGTASMIQGQDLTAVSTAGRGYDFSQARPVSAMAAAAWNVSNMDLLNDSSAAGSSYGSANALVGGNRNAMLLMQKEWADFYKDLFEVMGYDRPAVMFEPFEAPDKYREMQSLKLAQDGLSDEEYRMKILDIQDISGDPTEIPESLRVAADAAKAAVQQAAPDQGQSNGTNSGGGGANDQRSDTISSSEALRREMAKDDFLIRLEDLVGRLESAQK
jgi:hypothetical protein